MAFETENRKIENIFQRTAIYVVPRYQRDYVWKEVNWKELWIDLQFTLNNERTIPWSHFLGTIVLSRCQDKVDGLDKYEIIDGQQRLMTVYLLLMAIYKNFKRISKDTGNISNFIYENFLTSLTRESKRELMINNELYNEDLRFIITAASNNENISNNNKLHDPFVYFDNLLKDKDYDYLDKLLNKLLMVNIVDITSGEDEEIYNIFEVLNARGQKLKQIELLKNHIMKYIQPRETDFIDNAKNKWRNIQKNVEHLNDPDSLIQHFSKCYIEKNAENQNSIYRLIKEEVKVADLSMFLNDLENFSEIYKSITKKDSTDKVIRYFNIKRNQQIRSVICAILTLREKGIINEKTAYISMEQLLNFFFIFNTTQQTSNKTDKVISSISYEIYHCRYDIEFKMLFSNFLYDIQTYLNDKNIEQMFEMNTSFKYSNKDSTFKRNNALVKFILEQIYSIEQNDTLLDANNLTIEHLLPDDGSVYNSSIWNLTLTSQEINADELKTKPIIEKINILSNRSTIKSNQNLKQYILDDNFDFERRKKDLLDKIFNKIFVFEPGVFHTSKNNIDEYMNFEKLLKDKKDEELLSVLKKNGNYFETHLESNQSLKDLNDRWKSYKKIN